MIKQILYFLLIGAVGYGLYQLFKFFPVEATIVIGIIMVAIIIKWIRQTETL